MYILFFTTLRESLWRKRDRNSADKDKFAYTHCTLLKFGLSRTRNTYKCISDLKRISTRYNSMITSVIYQNIVQETRQDGFTSILTSSTLSFINTHLWRIEYGLINSKEFYNSCIVHSSLLLTLFHFSDNTHTTECNWHFVRSRMLVRNIIELMKFFIWLKVKIKHFHIQTFP